MINNLSLSGYQFEMTAHLIIVEGPDPRRTQPKCFSRKVQTVANSAGFKMHIAITTVSIVCERHDRDRQSSKRSRRRYRLGPDQDSGSGRDTLVATLGLFQLGTLRPEPVDAGL